MSSYTAMNRLHHRSHFFFNQELLYNREEDRQMPFTLCHDYVQRHWSSYDLSENCLIRTNIYYLEWVEGIERHKVLKLP